MQFQRPISCKRPWPYLATEALEPPRQPWTSLVTATPYYEVKFVPEHDPESHGSSSGFQQDQDPISIKRRKLDYSLATMPQDQGSPGSPGEKSGKPHPTGHQLDSDDSLLPYYWSYSSTPSAMRFPLAKQINSLTNYFCNCAAGLTWHSIGAYCPIYDANEAHQYGNEKQAQYMHMTPHLESQMLPLVEPGTLNPGPSEADNQTLSMTGYMEQERMQLASPPNSAKDSLFPQDRPPLAPLTDDYMAQDVGSNAMTFTPGYVSGEGQGHMNTAPDFPDTLGRHALPLRDSVPGCSDAPRFNMMPVGGGVGDQGPLNNWEDNNCAPHQSSRLDIIMPEQRGGKRGPFKDPKLREQTAQTRRTGSCIRCRMQRIRCEMNLSDPRGVCLTCTNVATTKAGRLPCLRYKITDVKLYKPGQVAGYEWTRRWLNNITDPIQNWASSEVKLISVSAGFSNKCVELQVRKFIPQDGDKLVRTWHHNGAKKSVEIPPYALINYEATKLTYRAHIEDIMTDTIRHVLGTSGGLLERTYFEAVKLMNDASTPHESAKLLSLTLTLWVSIRLSTTSGFLVGEETLGMSCGILDETSTNAGRIPMPPVLGAQLDLVLIHHIQTKLRREMLEALQKIVQKNKPATWLVTYLVSFILLHNTSLITRHDAGYARKHGMKRRFAREEKVREYHAGANILLGHFHYCNKGVFPFSDECKVKDLQGLADLGKEELQFVQATKDYVKGHRRKWERMRRAGEYDDDFFFVSQLFEEDWKPQATI
ncbi:tetratricopeptide repeat domain containing protein [Ophiocordyceps camponoti-floridani]|uniref:Tetratricopeptide repeat domain containing protein n=1 Tax=Ophiocordyceps camponoti-floridani TaxID=2030778 RepID=A0A8H4QBW0_9HYPO|nr:tetratricopeptide repeat domain containing protein [Ophiocordyceps camponoti-floridani]